MATLTRVWLLTALLAGGEGDDLDRIVRAFESPDASVRAVAQEKLRDFLFEPGGLREALLAGDLSAEFGLRLEDCVASTPHLLLPLLDLCGEEPPLGPRARTLLRAHLFRRVIRGGLETGVRTDEDDRAFDEGVVTGAAWPFADPMSLDEGLWILGDRFGRGRRYVVAPNVGATRPLDALDWIPGTPRSLVRRWSEERGLEVANDGAVRMLARKRQPPTAKGPSDDPADVARLLADALLGSGETRRRWILAGALLAGDGIDPVVPPAWRERLPPTLDAGSSRLLGALRSTERWVRTATLWRLARRADRARALAQEMLSGDSPSRWIEVGSLVWIDPPALLGPWIDAAPEGGVPAALARIAGRSGAGDDRPLRGSAAGAALEILFRLEGSMRGREEVWGRGDLTDEGIVEWFGFRWLLGPVERKALQARRIAARLTETDGFELWAEEIQRLVAAAAQDEELEARTHARALSLAALRDVCAGNTYRAARLHRVVHGEFRDFAACRALAGELFDLLLEEDVGRSYRWMEAPGQPWGGLGAPWSRSGD